MVAKRESLGADGESEPEQDMTTQQLLANFGEKIQQLCHVLHTQAAPPALAKYCRNIA